MLFFLLSITFSLSLTCFHCFCTSPRSFKTPISIAPARAISSILFFSTFFFSLLLASFSSLSACLAFVSSNCCSSASFFSSAWSFFYLILILLILLFFLVLFLSPPLFLFLFLRFFFFQVFITLSYFLDMLFQSSLVKSFFMTIWNKLLYFFKIHFTTIHEFNIFSEIKTLLSVRMRVDMENPLSTSAFSYERLRRAFMTFDMTGYFIKLLKLFFSAKRLQYSSIQMLDMYVMIGWFSYCKSFHSSIKISVCISNSNVFAVVTIVEME